MPVGCPWACGRCGSCSWLIRSLAWAGGIGGVGRAGGGGLKRQVLPAEKRIPGVRLGGVLGGDGHSFPGGRERDRGWEWAGLLFGRLWCCWGAFSFLGLRQCWRFVQQPGFYVAACESRCCGRKAIQHGIFLLVMPAPRPPGGKVHTAGKGYGTITWNHSVSRILSLKKISKKHSTIIVRMYISVANCILESDDIVLLGEREREKRKKASNNMERQTVGNDHPTAEKRTQNYHNRAHVLCASTVTPSLLNKAPKGYSINSSQEP